MPADPENSRYEMNYVDCILVQNGSFCDKKWNTYCFRHQYFAFEIMLLGESFWLANFSSLTISSWHLPSCFYTLVNHPLQPQLQCSVEGMLRHSDCNVWCGDISDKCYSMCGLIWPLYTDKKCSKSPFQNHLRILNAYGCRPQSGRSCLNLQWYKMVHLKMRIIVLIIYA